jgi:hypothetical protein
MADITFWKWQRTDRFGMPCVTRYRLTSRAGSEKLDELKREDWSLTGQDPNPVSSSDHGSAAKQIPAR